MAGIDAAVRELKARRDQLAEELRKIDQALEVLTGLGAAPARKAGKWRPGGRGRPPKAYVEKQAKAEETAKKPSKRRSRRGRKKRAPSEKQLAALAKARAAMAEKRAAAAAS